MTGADIPTSDLTGYRICDILHGTMTDSMGNLIRSTFARSNMSIRQLAKRANIGYATAHGMIRGSLNPSLTIVERICTVLDLELRPVRRGKRKAEVT
jgi:transcriptional regulator with XRE-family HTH domain